MEKEAKEKIPLILWSGGLDSTYLLQTELMKGDVEVLYVNGGQDSIKKAAEIDARYSMEHFLAPIGGKKRYKGTIRKAHIVNVSTGTNTPQHTFQQPLQWLNGAFEVIDYTKHSALLVGYISGDQIGPMLESIKVLWTTMQTVGKYGNVPVDFPLAFVSKLDILERIDPRLVQKIWVCETPIEHVVKTFYTSRSTFKRCKKCLPCRTMQTQLYNWKITHGEDYSKCVIRKLQEENNVKDEPKTLIDLVEIETHSTLD